MSKPLVSLRRIDQLKELAYDCGLTSEQAKAFGKLSKTSTWEALLDSHGLEFERVSPAVDIAYTECKQHPDQSDSQAEWTNDASFPVCNLTRHNPTNFLEWVDLSQLIAFTFASVGVFVLAMSMWRQINPLNLLPSPVHITIQIGAK